MSDERIDRHIETLGEPQAAALRDVRAQLAALLPGAEETIKYGMPCLAVAGKGVAGFDAFAGHWSYFPMSGSVVAAVDDFPDWVQTQKGTLRVPLDRRLSDELLRRMIRARLDEISATTKGKRRVEFHDDGTIKVTA